MFTPPDQTRISKIQVYARVTFPDPYEKWCSHQVSLSLDAVLGNEDPEATVRRLQAQVDALLAEHRAAILKRLAEEARELGSRAAARLPGDHVEVSGHADPDD